jgi:hypothetical protein
MPLRRFSEAVRKQNWFTVLIELLVVVVGVEAQMTERYESLLHMLDQG